MSSSSLSKATQKAQEKVDELEVDSLHVVPDLMNDDGDDTTDDKEGQQKHSSFSRSANKSQGFVQTVATGVTKVTVKPVGSLLQHLKKTPQQKKQQQEQEQQIKEGGQIIDDTASDDNETTSLLKKKQEQKQQPPISSLEATSKNKDLKDSVLSELTYINSNNNVPSSTPFTNTSSTPTATCDDEHTSELPSTSIASRMVDDIIHNVKEVRVGPIISFLLNDSSIVVYMAIFISFLVIIFSKPTSPLNESEDESTISSTRTMIPLNVSICLMFITFVIGQEFGRNLGEYRIWLRNKEQQQQQQTGSTTNEAGGMDVDDEVEDDDSIEKQSVYVLNGKLVHNDHAKKKDNKLLSVLPSPLNRDKKRPKGKGKPKDKHTFVKMVARPITKNVKFLFPEDSTEDYDDDDNEDTLGTHLEKKKRKRRYFTTLKNESSGRTETMTTSTATTDETTSLLHRRQDQDQKQTRKAPSRRRESCTEEINPTLKKMIYERQSRIDLMNHGNGADGSSEKEEQQEETEFKSASQLKVYNGRTSIGIFDEESILATVAASDTVKPLFRLRGMDLFLTTDPETNLGTHPFLLEAGLRRKASVLVNILTHWSNMVVYFELPSWFDDFHNIVVNDDDPDDVKAIKLFALGDDEYRNARLKIIPYLVDGNRVLKMMSPPRIEMTIASFLPISWNEYSRNEQKANNNNRANKTEGGGGQGQQQEDKEDENNIHSSTNRRGADESLEPLFEVEIDLMSTSVMRGVTNLMKRNLGTMVLDLAIIVEKPTDNSPDEPSACLGHFRFDCIDISACPSLPERIMSEEEDVKLATEYVNEFRGGGGVKER